MVCERKSRPLLDASTRDAASSVALFGDLLTVAELLDRRLALVLEYLLEELVWFVGNGDHATILLCVWYPATVP